MMNEIQVLRPVALEADTLKAKRPQNILLLIGDANIVLYLTTTVL